MKDMVLQIPHSGKDASPGSDLSHVCLMEWYRWRVNICGEQSMCAKWYKSWGALSRLRGRR